MMNHATNDRFATHTHSLYEIKLKVHYYSINKTHTLEIQCNPSLLVVSSRWCNLYTNLTRRVIKHPTILIVPTANAFRCRGGPIAITLQPRRYTAKSAKVWEKHSEVGRVYIYTDPRGFTIEFCHFRNANNQNPTKLSHIFGLITHLHMWWWWCRCDCRVYAYIVDLVRQAIDEDATSNRFLRYYGWQDKPPNTHSHLEAIAQINNGLPSFVSAAFCSDDNYFPRICAAAAAAVLVGRSNRNKAARPVTISSASIT